MAQQQADYNDSTPNNFPNDYDPSKIDSRVAIRANAVRGKKKGVDVRGALAQGVEIASVDATEAKANATQATVIARDLQDRWDSQINGKVDPSEVVDARQPFGGNAYKTLNERIEAGVDDRGKNVKAFGVKGDGSTDDLAAINNMIANSADGDTLFFPSGNYILSNSVMISKKINLVGTMPIYDSGDLVKGTVFRGGGIYFQTGSSGSKVSGIGVVTGPNVANGFDIHGTISSITIDRCITIARDHGYLIESYLGLVQNVKVLNCEAHDGIHGFISKATRTTFFNCLAQGLSSWGFGIISDNIPSASSIGTAIDNKVINCRAIKVGIAFAQYRRNYFEDNGATVPCSGNQFLGCSNQDCSIGLLIGDSFGDTGNGKYHTYPVSNTVVSNYTELGGQLQVNYSENLVLVGLSLQSDAQVANNDSIPNTGMIASSYSGGHLGDYENFITIKDTDTPNISFGKRFIINNSSDTVIKTLSGTPRYSEDYYMVLWDSNTVLDNGGNLYLNNGPLSGYGSSIQLHYQNGKFFEVSRTDAHNTSIQGNGTDPIAMGGTKFVDVVSNATAPNVTIKMKAPYATNPLLAIFIRSSNGTIKVNGFDHSQFIVPSDLPIGNLDFGTGLMTTWAYAPGLSKYVLVSWRYSSYI